MVSRRRVVGAVGAGATAAGAALLAACAPGLQTPLPRPTARAGADPPRELPPAPSEPAPALIPTPPQPVTLTRLAPKQIERIVQPFWSPDGAKLLFYDQPRQGQGGTWAIDVNTGSVSRERPEWGIYAAHGTLLSAPDTTERRSWVKHLTTGAEWGLPSTSPVFSNDATVVAYVLQGTLTVAGADDQGARRLSLPLSGATVLGWLSGTDRGATPNTRLLLYGRSGQDYGLFAYGLNDRRLIQLAASRRLPGYALSPDATWVAHVAMWNANPDQNGLWVTRTDGGMLHGGADGDAGVRRTPVVDGAIHRKLPFLGSARWTADNRLLVMPHRASPAESHELWEADPARGTLRRLVGPEQAQFRVANGDWDVSPDGTQLVFVGAQDRGLWRLTIPQLAPNAGSPEGVEPPHIPAVATTGTNAKPYRLPFDAPPGAGTWYVSQWYGVTTAGYRYRVSSYGEGQGIHFGIDFACPMRTPVVAIASGRVIAVDGDYGSPPHNVVLKLFDGNEAVYGHLAERSQHVNVGDVVQPGQTLGLSGDSLPPYDGNRNPHLHLEIRKQGRLIATNPVPYFDTNWDDMPLGIWNATLFERDLDNPRRYQFLDDQPDIRFGGPLLTNFARPWPPF